MSMNKLTITYWLSTGLVSLTMIYSAFVYITDPLLGQAFNQLGFPEYFRIELAIAKIIGVVMLLTPVSSWLKEWTYAGFVIVFVSAIVAHLVNGDPSMLWFKPVIFLAIHILSYVTYRIRIEKELLKLPPIQWYAEPQKIY